MLSDLSYIKNSGKGPIFILGQYPWGYIYVDNPYATYSTTYLFWKFSETMERHEKYYELHPEKRPEYIYLPKSPTLYISDEDYSERTSTNLTADSLAYIKNNYNCTVKDGKAGYIIKNLDYRDVQL
jgi:hypothetical protein